MVRPTESRTGSVRVEGNLLLSGIQFERGLVIEIVKVGYQTRPRFRSRISNITAIKYLEKTW